MRNLFFDLDGTLTNPEIGLVKSIQYALAKLKVSCPDGDELLQWIGPPLQNSFAEKLNTTDKTEIDRAMAFFRERYVKIGIFENEICDGVERLLSKLTSDHFPMYVVTSKPRVYAKKIVSHFKLSRFFKEIYGSELDGTRIDKGELIQYVLRQETLSPEHAVIIGDRKHDILGGKANQVAGIGVSWGFGSIAELEKAGAIAICHSPEALLELIKRMRK